MLAIIVDSGQQNADSKGHVLEMRHSWHWSRYEQTHNTLVQAKIYPKDMLSSRIIFWECRLWLLVLQFSGCGYRNVSMTYYRHAIHSRLLYK